jgi:hypothetical protein
MINQLVRCMLLYGKCYLLTTVRVINDQVWPTQRAVDPFSFYIFPETVSDISEADIAFEDYICSYESYRAKVDKGIFEEIPRYKLSAPVWPYHLIERLAHQGLSDPTEVDLNVRDKAKEMLDRVGSGFVSMSLVWYQTSGSLYQIYIVWNTTPAKIVACYKSRYDQPTYSGVVHRSLPGESYTTSMADDVVDLHYLANDTLTQFISSVRKERGIWGVNDNLVQRTDSITHGDAPIWHFKDDPKQAMSHIAPNMTSTNELRALQIFLALINSLSGAGTIAEGQPGRNMPRAGFAMQSLISLGMSDIQDVVKLIEQEVLTKGLDDLYRLSMQFIPDDQLIKIPGGVSLTRPKSRIMKKEDLYDDYEFEWIGANQFQDESIRAQRLMIFLNMVPQLNQMLMQQGYALNIVELLQTIWRYGLGERSLDKIIIPANDLQKALMQKIVMESSSSNGSSGGSSMGGIGYSLPSVTSGFVQQG